MKPKIIYQDEDLLVIDKPAGWIVNDATTTTNQPTVQSWLAKMDFPLAKNREFRSGIVHRLDKETSGLLIVAKTKETFEALQKEFKERKVQKTYTALVHGIVEPKEGIIEAPVGRLPWRRDRFGVLSGGREAKTDYKVIKSFEMKSLASHLKNPVSRISPPVSLSLLELYPKTGRTHQIRIHLKYIGHPIVADEFYAGRKTARADRKWCPRLFLHASRIKFIHPTSGEKVSFKSDLPVDLNRVLSNLPKV